ncbi:hypothetical protein DdX_02269 [Ditylenchus destructor]|uniref:Uncharacterized protein n=1 Tax=Ditylenchus destructor TaxID=166010 RepID=A0AAD4NFU5_9BILA|nr:hypothetical protein DdX_02269 [Ditylenchus destructor]
MAENSEKEGQVKWCALNHVCGALLKMTDNFSRSVGIVKPKAWNQGEKINTYSQSKEAITLGSIEIFRISGSHKSRNSPMYPAKPVAIDSARRDEAIHVSHARIRAPTRDLIFRISGSHKSRNSPMYPAKPVPIDSARRDEAIHVSHARIRAPTRLPVFPAISPRLTEFPNHKSRNSPMYPAKPVAIDSARRDEAIHVSHARIRAPTRDL